jgi:hypothetical protein
MVIILFKLSKLLYRKPRIIVTNDGIVSKNQQLHTWAEIKDEEVLKVKYSGKGSTINHYLSYTHPKGKLKQNIKLLGIEPEKLSYLLRVYRARLQ